MGHTACIFSGNSAGEDRENLFSVCRAQVIFCKYTKYSSKCAISAGCFYAGEEAEGAKQSVRKR
ncbi:hypothetical protein C7120_13385 [Prevotella sp. oral taxon 376]|nr:hypothetical protein C7120_13385 [Prevotella sp. oral taxon 376]